MSQSLKQLKENYLKEKQPYENEIDAFRIVKQKGIQILEDIIESSRYYTKTITDDQTAFYDGLRAVEGLDEEFQNTCQKEMKKIDTVLEDIESNYRRNYQKLSEQVDKNKKEGSEWEMIY